MNSRYYKIILLLSVIGLLVLLSSAALASVNHTQAEAVQWAKDRANERWNVDYDGAYGVQCVDLIRYYVDYLGLNVPHGFGRDYAYVSANNLSNIAYYSGFIPNPGDIAVWTVSAGSTNGHVGIVISADSNGMRVVDCCGWNENINSHTFAYESPAAYSRTNYDYFYGVLRPDFKSTEPDVYGEPMQTGYDRVLPDGDYMIASAADQNYFLDISGADRPAKEGEIVQLWHTSNISIGDCDAWTIKYDNGFYRISQYGHNMSLDVPGASKKQGEQIWIYGNNDTIAQQWAISYNGNLGYRIEACSSGFSLHIPGESLSEGKRIQQYSDDDSNAQRWLFIPYKPAHTLPEGRYILVSAMDDNLELDIAGDTGDIENGRNLQVWYDNSTEFYEGNKSRYNAFDVTYYADGYYQLAQAVSGKVIDVDNWVGTNGGNLQMWSNDRSPAQLWAITETYPGSGKYFLRSKCSGLAMEIDWSNAITNGTNVQQWHYYCYGNNSNQLWKFVKAEHTVTYDANGGSGAPSSQIKYYKGKLLLSETVPVREGYEFLGWGTSSDAIHAAYQPGGEYRSDSDITLYAIWERVSNIITYDANGGQYAPSAQTKLPEESIVLTSAIPSRTGYTFIGWATDPTATIAEYMPGDTYSADADLMLYALWQITNPPTLTGAEIDMLVGDSRKWQELVTLTHDGVLNYTLKATSTGSAVTLTGEQITAKSVGSATITVSVVEYPSATCTLTVNVVEVNSILKLPAALTVIEDEAFAHVGAAAVIIPTACERIGAKAFADNPSLVFVFVPESVTSIADDAFTGSPSVTIYCYQDSAAHRFAEAKGIHYVLLTNDWVTIDNLPLGAAIVDEKWTYCSTTVETTTSTETSLEGWEQTGYSWKSTGNTGTVQFASYPEGFSQKDAGYKLENRAAYETVERATSKREYSEPSFYIYCYWHWCCSDSFENGNGDVPISDHSGNQDGLNYAYFDRIRTSIDISDQRDGKWNAQYYSPYNKAENGSWWWYRFIIYQQTYTDYEKLFAYSRTTTVSLESGTPVTEGNGISNVQHWVKYGF